jgi:outer membrane protein
MNLVRTPMLFSWLLQLVIFSPSTAALAAMQAPAPGPTSTPRASPSATPLAFREAVKLALERTESPKIQELGAVQAEERVSQAKGGILPSVALSGVYTRQDTAGSGNAATSSFTRPDQRTVKIGLTQPVFRGLREFAGLRAAEAQSRASQSQARQARVSVYSSVGQAYYALAAAELELADLNELLEISRSRVKEIRERVRIGRTRRGELLSAEAQVASVEAQLQAAEVSREQARANLAYLTGIGTPGVDLGAEPPLPQKIEPLATWLARVESRPDVAAQKELVTSQMELVSVAKGAYLPTVDAGANWYLDRTGVLANTKWDFSVSATLPLFQGGVTQSQVREAAARSQAQELALEQTRRTAVREVQSSWQAADGSLQQVRFLELAVQAAEKNWREQQKDYRLGLVTNLDVLQALNSYQEAKRSFDRARMQVRASLVALEAAAGEMPQ